MLVERGVRGPKKNGEDEGEGASDELPVPRYEIVSHLSPSFNCCLLSSFCYGNPRISTTNRSGVKEVVFQLLGTFSWSK